MRCRILSLLWLLAFACIGVAQAQTRVELRDTFPSGPDITVAPGANVYLRIAYDTSKPAHIWVRPYYQGKQVDAGSSPSLEYTGKGELLGFFFLMNSGQVDEIRVTAGDGSFGGTPEIARWPIRVHAYSRAPAPPAEPAWVAAMRDADRQVMDAAIRAQASQPVGVGSMAIFGGFMLVFAVLGIAGLAWPIWALWRWRDRWRWWAAVPLAALGFVMLRILIDTTRDPTSHNLWPFEILMFGGGSVAAMAVLWVLRRLSR